MSAHPPGWEQLSADWQQQPTAPIDLERLRQEARRQGRWLRWSMVAEVAMGLLVVALCAYIALLPDATGREQGLFIGLALFVLGYQTWVVRMRWRDLHGEGQDARALLALETRRCRSTLAYWRWGMWLGVALWVGLYGLFMGSLTLGWTGLSIDGLIGGLGANVVLYPLIGAYGVWRSHRARQRLQHLQALREQLLDA